MRRWFRKPETKQELTMNVRDEEYVRPKRRNIPTTWDDKPVGRNAKKPRYKDHRRGKRNKRDAD